MIKPAPTDPCILCDHSYEVHYNIKRPLGGWYTGCYECVVLGNPQHDGRFQLADYKHVHDCAAAREGRPCTFEWSEHIESAECICGPVLDERDAALSGQVFVVHQGVC